VTPHLWFDADHTHAAAGVFLLTRDDKLVLQLRDDIPDIDNPGMITAFGGAAEPGETAIDCALREIEEETGLRVDPMALRYVGAVSKRDRNGDLTACVFFVLRIGDASELTVTEGAAITLSFDEIANDTRTTPTCRNMATEIMNIIRCHE
jgi:8-oxo-dGTP pyrophosphatase MutT (NUDIX family)